MTSSAIATHVSLVFFLGDRVYKLKKPSGPAFSTLHPGCTAACL